MREQSSPVQSSPCDVQRAWLCLHSQPLQQPLPVVDIERLVARIQALGDLQQCGKANAS